MLSLPHAQSILITLTIKPHLLMICVITNPNSMITLSIETLHHYK